MGRGGGIRLAAAAREETGPLYVLNGDELIDADLSALLAAHRSHGGAATIVVAPLPTGFGVVDVDEEDRVRGFDESPQLPYWANAGVYVLDDDALARLPERGDHEQSTFPELAREGSLYAFRHEGIWLTVNTPKDLRVADDHLRGNPDWLQAAAKA
jgi:NDP-sugar pyrophosphorylase family protein